MNGKIISGPAAILILLLFFLPWVSVSCGDRLVGDFSGYQLASMDDGVPLFFIIPLVAIVSLILMVGTLFMPSQEAKVNVVLMIAPGLGLGVFFLQWLDFQFQNESLVEINTLPALWLTVAALLGMMLGAVFDLLRPIIKRLLGNGASDKQLPPNRLDRQTVPSQPWNLPKAKLRGKATLMEETRPGNKPGLTVIEDDTKATIMEGDTLETLMEGDAQATLMEGDDKTLQEDRYYNRTLEDKTASYPGDTPAHQVRKTETLHIDPNLKAWFVIGSGKRKGDRFKLLADTTIGRDPNCDIYIDDTAMSALHVRVKMVNGRFTVYDQNSTNGLYIFHLEQERWVRREQVILQDGTRIKLGRTILVFMSLNPDN